MLHYLARRILWAVPTLFGAVTMIFFIMHILPGDIVTVITADGGRSPELIAEMRRELGTDRPVVEQYGRWLTSVLSLDFGTSLWSNQPVARELATRLPYSLVLVLLATAISVLIAVPVGVLSALKQDTWIDYTLRCLTVAGLSIPSFWFAILIVVFLLNVFSWFPPLGYASLVEQPWVAIQQLIFPALALGYRQSAVAARMLRSSMLEVLHEDYVRTARAKGLGNRTVHYLHALKNAILPVITVFGLELVALFSGAVVVEKIFNVPGIGSLLVDAIVRRDVPVIQGAVFAIVAFVLFVNLAVDLTYAWIDHRIRFQ
jgi:peptide/nickel transport system permease protein